MRLSMKLPAASCGVFWRRRIKCPGLSVGSLKSLLVFSVVFDFPRSPSEFRPDHHFLYSIPGIMAHRGLHNHHRQYSARHFHPQAILENRVRLVWLIFLGLKLWAQIFPYGEKSTPTHKCCILRRKAYQISFPCLQHHPAF